MLSLKVQSSSVKLGFTANPSSVSLIINTFELNLICLTAMFSVLQIYCIQTASYIVVWQKLVVLGADQAKHALPVSIFKLSEIGSN